MMFYRDNIRMIYSRDMR